MAVTIKRAKKAVQTSAKPKFVANRGAGNPAKSQILMRSLGPEKMALVEVRLLNGEAGEAIARSIQTDWKLMKDHKLLSLSKLLTDHRARVLIPKLAVVGTPDAKAMNTFAERVDVLENLTKLIEIQQARVSKGFHFEKQVPDLLDRKLRHEVDLLGNLYAKLANLQMDLGLLRKVPAKLQIEGMASRTQQALQDAMSKSRRVEEALSKAFAVLDGKFSVVEDAKHKH